MKTINSKFVEMVGTGCCQGRVMSDADFFEMLNPVQQVQKIGREEFDCSVATVVTSDKYTYFKYRVCYVPELSKYVIVYYAHKMWNLWKLSSNLFDVLNCIYSL